MPNYSKGAYNDITYFNITSSLEKQLFEMRLNQLDKSIGEAVEAISRSNDTMNKFESSAKITEYIKKRFNEGNLKSIPRNINYQYSW
eukprot:UN15668